MYINMQDLNKLICTEIVNRLGVDYEMQLQAVDVILWNIKEDISANRYMPYFRFNKIADDTEKFRIHYLKSYEVEKYLVIQYFDDQLQQGYTIERFADESALLQALRNKGEEHLSRIILLKEGVIQDVESNLSLSIKEREPVVQEVVKISALIDEINDYNMLGSGYWEELYDLSMHTPKPRSLPSYLRVIK